MDVFGVSLFAGIIVFLLGLALYFGVKGRRAGFLFLSGIGAGLVIAAGLFAAMIYMMA
jgi:hypothetical protein